MLDLALQIKFCSDKRLHVERDHIRKCWMKAIFSRSRQKPFINLVIQRTRVALLEDGEEPVKFVAALKRKKTIESISCYL